MPWKKKDTSVEQPTIPDTVTEQPAAPAEPLPQPADETPAPKKRRGRPPKVQAPAEPTVEAETASEPDIDPHHTEAAARRGRYRFAAWVGLTVILLAVFGFISLMVLGVNLVKNAFDNSELMEELHVRAYPIIYHQPDEFDSPDEADQALLLRAACFSVVKKEEVRQLREAGEGYVEKYKTDEYARYIVSATEVTAAYKQLFGEDATPTLQTIGSDNQKYAQFEYDKANNCMYLPGSYATATSAYETVADGLRLRGDVAYLRIGYVLKTKLEIDDLGRQIDPTADQAEFFQTFVFERTADEQWILTAVQPAEKKK